MNETSPLLRPHPNSALEYWFFKVNVGSRALLVDWIARRKTGKNELRAAFHTPQRHDVLFCSRTPIMDESSFLHARRTRGQCNSLAWDLEIQPSQEFIRPDVFPAGTLRLSDLTLVSAPLARFSGWIDFAGEHVLVKNAPGLVSHYWGRRLSDQWWWLSASDFNQPDVSVEFSMLRTSLWGLPLLKVPFGYLYLNLPGRRLLLTTPPGRVRLTGSVKRFEIDFRYPFIPGFLLKAWGRDYNDLGEGIQNTLVGDLEIWEGDMLLARAEQSAGLERRSPGNEN